MFESKNNLLFETRQSNDCSSIELSPKFNNRYFIKWDKSNLALHEPRQVRCSLGVNLKFITLYNYIIRHPNNRDNCILKNFKRFN